MGTAWHVAGISGAHGQPRSISIDAVGPAFAKRRQSVVHEWDNRAFRKMKVCPSSSIRSEPVLGLRTKLPF